jgi:hypothetical protein
MLAPLTGVVLLAGVAAGLNQRTGALVSGNAMGTPLFLMTYVALNTGTSGGVHHAAARREQRHWFGVSPTKRLNTVVK